MCIRDSHGLGAVRILPGQVDAGTEVGWLNVLKAGAAGCADLQGGAHVEMSVLINAALPFLDAYHGFEAGIEPGIGRDYGDVCGKAVFVRYIRVVGGVDAKLEIAGQYAALEGR